jgi:tetratricopeptide (TPR) repeat protein
VNVRLVIGFAAALAVPAVGGTMYYFLLGCSGGGCGQKQQPSTPPPAQQSPPPQVVYVQPAPAPATSEPAPAPAPSEPPEQRARTLHDRAKKFFDAGRFDDAIREWQAAYDLDAKPQFLYNLANCYKEKAEINRSAPDYRRAKHFFQRFQSLSSTPDVSEELRDIEVAIKRIEG